METLIMADKFKGKDPIMVLRFLAHIKRACDLNEVLERMAFWIVQIFMEDRPASSLTAQMTTHEDDGTTKKLSKERKEQISTYVEAGKI